MMNNMEIWKDIEGYEGKYQVSNLGRFFSKKSNKILKPSNCGRGKNGYLFCGLYNNGKSKPHYIHIETAKYFIGERPHGLFVHHIDGNSLNNNVENLEYTTNSRNVAAAYDSKDRLTGAHKSPSKSGRYYATIWHKKKKHYLGMYDTEQEAHEVYIKKRDEFEKQEYEKLGGV